MKKLNIFSFCALGVALFITACDKSNMDPASPSSGNQPGSARVSNADDAGYVYTESNQSDTNRIIIYHRHRDGSLTLKAMIASGGSGTGSGLGSQGSLKLHDNHNWLFAVNAGNNTVSSFKVLDDGGLKLTYTISSGGTLPISVTAHEKYLYVLNANSYNINGFKIHDDGTLSAISGSQQSLSGPATSPEQISFDPGGNHVYVTEKVSNFISSFAINSSGVAQAGVFNNAVGVNPYGFAFAHGSFMIVSNAAGGNAGASTVTSYKDLGTGVPVAVNGAVADSETAACWLTTTHSGRYAYVCNAGSNTISLFAVAWDGTLTLLNINAAPGNHPIDIIATHDDAFVYNINSNNQTIGEFSRASNGALTNIGYVTSLPASAGGLAGFTKETDGDGDED